MGTTDLRQNILKSNIEISFPRKRVMEINQRHKYWINEKHLLKEFVVYLVLYLAKSFNLARG